jgi:vacuolar-type H+-ATPase subunit D/Vma8
MTLEEQVTALRMQVDEIGQQYAEVLERMEQMQAAMAEQFQQALTAMRAQPGPQVTVTPEFNVPQAMAPVVQVAAPVIEMPDNKGATWEIAMPGFNGGPPRVAFVKRTN